MSFLKSLARFIFGLIAPILVIIVGAVIAGFGITNDYSIVTWTGLIVIGAGIVWGFVMFSYYGDF